MAASVDSRQFDGTLKSAKDICAWIADPAKAVFGPSFAEHDTDPAGLNLVSTGKDAADNEHPVYETVSQTDWVVRGASGFAIFTDAQFRFAYGAEAPAVSPAPAPVSTPAPAAPGAFGAW